MGNSSEELRSDGLTLLLHSFDVSDVTEDSHELATIAD
jgi:hypothetical protein